LIAGRDALEVGADRAVDRPGRADLARVALRLSVLQARRGGVGEALVDDEELLAQRAHDPRPESGPDDRAAVAEPVLFEELFRLVELVRENAGRLARLVR